MPRTQNISPEELAKLFYSYREMLASDFGLQSSEGCLCWGANPARASQPDDCFGTPGAARSGRTKLCFRQHGASPNSVSWSCRAACFSSRGRLSEISRHLFVAW